MKSWLRLCMRLRSICTLRKKVNQHIPQNVFFFMEGITSTLTHQITWFFNYLIRYQFNLWVPCVFSLQYLPSLSLWWQPTAQLLSVATRPRTSLWFALLREQSQLPWWDAAFHSLGGLSLHNQICFTSLCAMKENFIIHPFIHVWWWKTTLWKRRRTVLSLQNEIGNTAGFEIFSTLRQKKSKENSAPTWCCC